MLFFTHHVSDSELPGYTASFFFLVLYPRGTFQKQIVLKTFSLLRTAALATWC